MRDKEETFTFFSKYDKIGVILLCVGGLGVIYDISPTLGHFLIGDFQHVNQTSLLPIYIEIPVYIIGFFGLYLFLRFVSYNEGCL